MEVKLKGRSLLALLIFACVNDFTFTADVPIDFDQELFTGIEESFFSLLSDELKEKLLKKAEQVGKGMNLQTMVTDDLSESEKNKIEEALMKVLQPFIGEFLQAVSKTGIPSVHKLKEDHKLKNQSENEKKIPEDKQIIGEEEGNEKEAEREPRAGVNEIELETEEIEKGQKEEDKKKEESEKNQEKKGNKGKSKMDKDEL